MIGPFGLLTTGFVPKRVTDIVSQIQATLAGFFGAGFLFDSTTPEANLLQTFALQLADVWEADEQTYNSQYPDTASGTSLDNSRGGLSNVPRIPATFSVANGVIITGAPGANVPASFKLSVAGNSSAVFQISAQTTIGGGGTVAASFVCLQVGPVAAPAGQLNVIVNPAIGVGSASNPTAAQLGTFAETDSAYRLRSAQQLNAPGGSTFSGLGKAVLAVPNVSKIFEFINDGDVADVNGLKPHSVLIIATGGVDQDIANAIFAAKAGGIQTNGNVAGTVVDSQGNSHASNFSRVLNTPIFLDVAVTKNLNPAMGPVYPTNGDDLVKSAILSYGATFQPGQTVVDIGFFTPINSIPGVLNAVVLMGTVFPPASTANIPIAIDHVATFPAPNVVVHS
jgi:uncharacterized phage protein gp47/JayE